MSDVLAQRSFLSRLFRGHGNSESKRGGGALNIVGDPRVESSGGVNSAVGEVFALPTLVNPDLAADQGRRTENPEPHLIIDSNNVAGIQKPKGGPIELSEEVLTGGGLQNPQKPKEGVLVVPELMQVSAPPDAPPTQSLEGTDISFPEPPKEPEIESKPPVGDNMDMAEQVENPTQPGISLGERVDDFLAEAKHDFAKNKELRRGFEASDLRGLTEVLLSSEEVKKGIGDAAERLSVGEIEIKDGKVKAGVIAQGTKLIGPFRINVDFDIILEQETGDRVRPGRLGIHAESKNPLAKNKINGILKGEGNDPKTKQPRVPVDINEIVTGTVRQRVDPNARSALYIKYDCVYLEIINPSPTEFSGSVPPRIVDPLMNSTSPIATPQPLEAVSPSVSTPPILTPAPAFESAQAEGVSDDAMAWIENYSTTSPATVPAMPAVPAADSAPLVQPPSVAETVVTPEKPLESEEKQPADLSETIKLTERYGDTDRFTGNVIYLRFNWDAQKKVVNVCMVDEHGVEIGPEDKLGEREFSNLADAKEFINESLV